jgi:hypothetical protein
LPGRVAKVRLSDFTRVGALTLNAGENDLVSAVIDPTGGFAYFGTNDSPGRVVKVRLSDFTRVGALTLNAGEDTLFSAVIDPTGGFAYFGTFTWPGIVVKVRLSDFTRVGALALNAWEDDLNSGVIDPTGGFAYFGTGTSPGIVVRVDLGNSRTTVISSANPSIVGQAVTFTATVSAVTGAGTPTGTVQFKVDGANLGTPVALSGGSASISTTALAIGTHTVTAEYSGDDNFNPSTGALSGGQVVGSRLLYLPVIVR